MRLRKFQALSTLAEPGASPDADNCRIFGGIRAAQVTRTIEIGCNTAVDAGLYTFTFAKTGAKVSGRNYKIQLTNNRYEQF